VLVSKCMWPNRLAVSANGAAGGAAASALAAVHASNTQIPAMDDHAAELESLRAELAQSNRRVDVQVVDIHDLQTKWDAEHQKCLQQDLLIQQLRLEPDREKQLKDQHRRDMTAVERERDALKADMTKINGCVGHERYEQSGQDTVKAVQQLCNDYDDGHDQREGVKKLFSDLQGSLGDRLTKADGLYTTAVQSLVDFEVAVIAAFGDKPPSVENAAAQVKQDQVTIKAMWDTLGTARTTTAGRGSLAIKKLVEIEEAFIAGFHLVPGDDVLAKITQHAAECDDYLIMKADESANGGVTPASVKEELEKWKKDSVTLSQHYQDAVKKVAELTKSDLMVKHILCKDEWVGIVDVQPFCDRFDAELLILEESRQTSGAGSNQMITECVRNLRKEKEGLESVINQFKVDMAKLTNDPSQLGAEVVKIKSANLDLEQNVAASSTELANVKGELLTAKGKFQKCEDDLVQCQSKLGAAEHDLDSYKTRLQDDQQKIVDLEKRNAALVASQTSAGRSAPPGSSSSDPSPAELDDVVSRLLREFQLLVRPAGGTSTNEKAQRIAEAINKVLDTIPNQNVRVEACRMIVNRLHLTLGGRAALSLDITEDMKRLRHLSQSSSGV
jgi:predicted  nucleic acid-binding Zn-ribbon protein